MYWSGRGHCDVPHRAVQRLVVGGGGQYGPGGAQAGDVHSKGIGK